MKYIIIFIIAAAWCVLCMCKAAKRRTPCPICNGAGTTPVALNDGEIVHIACRCQDN